MADTNDRIGAGVSLADIFRGSPKKLLLEYLNLFDEYVDVKSVADRTQEELVEIYCDCCRRHPLHLTAYFAIFTEDMWKCLVRALDRGRCRVRPEDVAPEWTEKERGARINDFISMTVVNKIPWVQVSPGGEDSFIWEIADEIRDYWLQNRDEFLEYRELSNVFFRFSIAAVNLYGLIGCRKLCDCFFKYHQDRLSYAMAWEMVNWIPHRAMLELTYGFIQELGEIARYDVGANPKMVTELHQVQDKIKEPWLPENESEFLAYTEERHFSDTKAVADVAELYLHQHFEADTVMINEGMQCFGRVFRVDPDDSKFTRIQLGLLVRDIGADVKEMAVLLSAIRNTTRSWKYFGHTAEEVGDAKMVPLDCATPAELGHIAKHLALREKGCMPLELVARPGRNDPCPCGSGKKYKKCCAKRMR